MISTTRAKEPRICYTWSSKDCWRGNSIRSNL